MCNQKCEVRSLVININSNDSLFYLYGILVKNVVVARMILIIHMLNYMFLLLLLETWIPKCSIKYQELMKQDMYFDMRLVHVNVD